MHDLVPPSGPRSEAWPWARPLHDLRHARATQHDACVPVELQADGLASCLCGGKYRMFSENFSRKNYTTYGGSETGFRQLSRWAFWWYEAKK